MAAPEPMAMAMPGCPLGYIVPSKRTPQQTLAHANAMIALPNFALPFKDVPKGTKVLLTDYWKHPDVVADLGMEFTGFGQFTGSCLPAGALVRMADGSEKPIEEICVGEEVISHTGHARSVVQTMNRKFTGKMITLHFTGYPFPITVTADHSIAILQTEDKIAWVRADEVQEQDKALIGWDREKDYTVSIDLAELLNKEDVLILDELMKDNAFTKGNEPDVPVSNFKMARKIVRESGVDWHDKVKIVRSRAENVMPRHLPMSPSLARFIGIYLAEGGCHEGRVTFSLHKKEKVLAGEILTLARGLFGAEGVIGRKKKVKGKKRPKSMFVRFAHLGMATVIKTLIPGDVYSKRIPGVFFSANKETKRALLLGWIAGDGHVSLKKAHSGRFETRIQGTTSSPDLARDMITLALSCKIKASASKRKPRKQSKTAYDVYLNGPKALSLFPALIAEKEATGQGTIIGNNPKSGVFTKFGFARTIKRIDRESVSKLQVYDFEVEEDHSFLAGGITVHNCVGVSNGNAINTAAFVQRVIGEHPIIATIVWWPFCYGRTRTNEGDRGQGEGAVDSVMGDTVVKEGFFDIKQEGLPQFSKMGPDGFWLSKQLELQWSDGSRIDQKWKTLAAKNTGTTKTVCGSVADIQTSIVNGYPILDGCNNYVGKGSIKGSGDTAYVTGRYDGSGGHSTCFLGFWSHPNDGPLYLYSNQWPTETYPKDPAGAGRCCVWLAESEVTKLFRTGGDRGETMSYSNIPGQPAQPKVLEWGNM